jgi:hypothetical protein
MFSGKIEQLEALFKNILPARYCVFRSRRLQFPMLFPKSPTVVHIHEDDLELYTQGRLELEHIAIAESHLLECESCRQLLAERLGQRLALLPTRAPESNSTTGRREPRFSAEGEATVQELHPLSLDRHKVKIVNVSKNGLGILGPKAILAGTIVQLRINDTIELANVQYCSPLEGGVFRIGLRLHGEG